ncbi:ABC transporter ATP-binding protein [Fusobacterium polymorphum]|uniref:ABC transporter ATP-binding protein n=1 Tax=Fusobacterium nucleatum subsp. polymorphum TaxID=76857 RepID=A0A2B7Y7Z5_FUSNP|nr:AAA family ATPase [Fusobacterium polymorphum]PGH20204.1 ABC transporter ATP-binding protein [Fusobacterium polymorphum]
MEIFIKNIGKVKEANIKIDGITVIAGENDTGKSTISKSLFTVFNSFYNIDKKITEQQKDIIKFTIAKNFAYNFELVKSITLKGFFGDTFNVNQLIDELIENFETYKDNNVKLKNTIVEHFKKYNFNLIEDNNINEIIEKIKEVLSIPRNEAEKSILNENLNNEFNKQINNIFLGEEGIIELKIKDKRIKLKLFENKVEKIENTPRINISTEALYLDDPFIIDSNFYNKPSNHKEFLRYRLFSKVDDKTNNLEKIIISKKFENIYKKLNSVCSGNMIESNKNTNDFSYRFNNKELDIKNLSAGLKTFVILKTLLEKGILEENGVIILDEPEIHLHPAWQVIFAELIVLIQKEFNMHILLNTHSPYFLNAIEIYADKHSIKEKCNFYSAYLSEQFSEFKDVTDNIEEIYYKLARPFQDLENERYSDD